MANLTSQQVNELADHFLAMAQSTEEFRSKNFDHLSGAQNQSMRDLHEFILNCSDQLYTLSATLVMDDVQTSLSLIGEVTNQMETTLMTLQDVQKAINVAASAVTLGKAILDRNPQEITRSVLDFADLLSN